MSTTESSLPPRPRSNTSVRRDQLDQHESPTPPEFFGPTLLTTHEEGGSKGSYAIIPRNGKYKVLQFIHAEVNPIGDIWFDSLEEAMNSVKGSKDEIVMCKHTAGLIGGIRTDSAMYVLAVTKLGTPVCLPFGYTVRTVAKSEWVAMEWSDDQKHAYLHIQNNDPDSAILSKESMLEILKWSYDATLGYYCSPLDLTLPYPQFYTKKSLFPTANPALDWNHWLREPFRKSGYEDACVLALRGVAAGKMIKQRVNKQPIDFTVCIISKQCNRNPNPRYLGRGLHEENKSPGNEYWTEVIVSWDDQNPERVNFVKYVMLRGTVPLTFKTEPTIGEANIIVGEDAENGFKEYTTGLLDNLCELNSREMKYHIAKDGEFPHVNLAYVNLLKNKRHGERDLSDAYERAISNFKNNNKNEKWTIDIVNCDFLHTKSAADSDDHFIEEIVSQLVAKCKLGDKSHNSYPTHGYIRRSSPGHYTIAFEHVQANFVRVNCADSLDRTNCVSYFLCDYLLQLFFTTLHLSMSQGLRKLVAALFVYNGNVISEIFTGTEALHSHYIRNIAEEDNQAKWNFTLNAKRKINNTLFDKILMQRTEMLLGRRKKVEHDSLTLLADGVKRVGGKIKSLFKVIRGKVQTDEKPEENPAVDKKASLTEAVLDQGHEEDEAEAEGQDAQDEDTDEHPEDHQIPTDPSNNSMIMYRWKFKSPSTATQQTGTSFEYSEFEDDEDEGKETPQPDKFATSPDFKPSETERVTPVHLPDGQPLPPLERNLAAPTNSMERESPGSVEVAVGEAIPANPDLISFTPRKEEERTRSWAFAPAQQGKTTIQIDHSQAIDEFFGQECSSPHGQVNVSRESTNPFDHDHAHLKTTFSGKSSPCLTPATGSPKHSSHETPQSFTPQGLSNLLEASVASEKDLIEQHNLDSPEGSGATRRKLSIPTESYNPFNSPLADSTDHFPADTHDTDGKTSLPTESVPQSEVGTPDTSRPSTPRKSNDSFSGAPPLDASPKSVTPPSAVPSPSFNKNPRDSPFPPTVALNDIVAGVPLSVSPPIPPPPANDVASTPTAVPVTLPPLGVATLEEVLGSAGTPSLIPAVASSTALASDSPAVTPALISSTTSAVVPSLPSATVLSAQSSAPVPTTSAPTPVAGSSAAAVGMSTPSPTGSTVPQPSVLSSGAVFELIPSTPLSAPTVVGLYTPLSGTPPGSNPIHQGPATVPKTAVAGTVSLPQGPATVPSRSVGTDIIMQSTSPRPMVASAGQPQPAEPIAQTLIDSVPFGPSPVLVVASGAAGAAALTPAVIPQAAVPAVLTSTSATIAPPSTDAHPVPQASATPSAASVTASAPVLSVTVPPVTQNTGNPTSPPSLIDFSAVIQAPTNTVQPAIDEFFSESSSTTDKHLKHELSHPVSFTDGSHLSVSQNVSPFGDTIGVLSDSHQSVNSSAFRSESAFNSFLGGDSFASVTSTGQCGVNAPTLQRTESPAVNLQELVDTCILTRVSSGGSSAQSPIPDPLNHASSVPNLSRSDSLPVSSGSSPCIISAMPPIGTISNTVAFTPAAQMPDISVSLVSAPADNVLTGCASAPNLLKPAVVVKDIASSGSAPNLPLNAGMDFTASPPAPVLAPSAPVSSGSTPSLNVPTQYQVPPIRRNSAPGILPEQSDIIVTPVATVADLSFSTAKKLEPPATSVNPFDSPMAGSPRKEDKDMFAGVWESAKKEFHQVAVPEISDGKEEKPLNI